MSGKLSRIARRRSVSEYCSQRI